jgi:hypothetical protein
MPVTERIAPFPSLSFAGLPIVVSPLVPANELWLIVEGEGKRETIHAPSLPLPEETVEEWIKRARIHRIINIGPDTSTVKFPRVEFKL